MSKNASTKRSSPELYFGVSVSVKNEHVLREYLTIKRWDPKIGIFHGVFAKKWGRPILTASNKTSVKKNPFVRQNGHIIKEIPRPELDKEMLQQIEKQLMDDHFPETVVAVSLSS